MLPSLSCFSSASCRWFWFVWFFGLDFLPFDLRSHWSMRWYSLEKRRDDTNEGFSLVFPFFFHLLLSAIIYFFFLLLIFLFLSSAPLRTTCFSLYYCHCWWDQTTIEIFAHLTLKLRHLHQQK